MNLNKRKKYQKKQAEEKEKEQNHQDQVEMCNTLWQLAEEKRSLLIQHVAETQKWNKVMVNAIMEQINNIEMEISDNIKKLLTMQNTPKKNNRTP